MEAFPPIEWAVNNIDWFGLLENAIEELEFAKADKQ